MKKLILLFALLIIGSTYSVAQENNISLYQMNKVQLSTIYLEQVNRVIAKMPTVAFDSAMTDVPKSKYLAKKFIAVNRKIASYNKTLMKQYGEIVPYADKKDLIEAILYLEKL